VNLATLKDKFDIPVPLMVPFFPISKPFYRHMRVPARNEDDNKIIRKSFKKFKRMTREEKYIWQVHQASVIEIGTFMRKKCESTIFREPSEKKESIVL